MKTPAILQAFRNDILPAGARLLQAEDPVAVGGHRLAGRLRSSGAGIVYVAHGSGAELVTIKTTHPETAAEPEPVRARLRAEAACSRRLPASCTVRLLDDGTDRTPPYLVSEHLDGPSLEQIIDVKGPLPLPLVKALAADLAQALATVHSAGVMHGDLAPGNVLFTKGGLRLIDFGVAEDIPADPAEIGAVADHPGWLAPELLTDGPPSPACDIFGWGCLVVYAATGHSPYRKTAPGGPARFRPLDTGALRQPLSALVHASIAEDPADRPAAADLVAGLAAHVPREDPPIPATPVTFAVRRARRPRRVRTRALVAALVTLAALLITVPTAIEHPSTPPPRAAGPVAPPKKPRPKRSSNAAARALQARPPVTTRRTPPAPRRPAARRPGGRLWMSCPANRPDWCSMPGTPEDSHRSPGWRLSWTAGG